jgi:hypothetical protein
VATPRALEGIPTSVKDEDASAGWPLTAGSVLMKDNRAIDPDGRYAVGGARRAARPDRGAGALFHSADLEPAVGRHRNPWNLPITVGNWPHPRVLGGSRAAPTSGAIGQQLKIVASLRPTGFAVFCHFFIGSLTTYPICNMADLPVATTETLLIVEAPGTPMR